MAFVRSIGRWSMTALVVNSIIGNSIFGLPGELTRLLGRASPLAMLVAAVIVSMIVACMAEVASQHLERTVLLLACPHQLGIEVRIVVEFLAWLYRRTGVM